MIGRTSGLFPDVAPAREILFTPEADSWYKALGNEDRARLVERIEQLRETGSTLGWPAVERIKSSQHHKMKELRSKTGNLRVLFAFDPRRRAVLLVGGDKTNNWKRWYKDNIPKADRLFDQHLRNMGGEGPWRDGGNRSDGRAR